VLSEKTDLRIHITQVVGVFGALGTILVIIACLRAWRDRNLWWFAKVWNFVLVLACLGFLWFALYWNVLNFNLNY
jgi:hypothetical protein